MWRRSLVVLVAALCGCAHTHILPSPPDPTLEQHFNAAVSQARVTVERVQGDALVVRGVAMKHGAITWFDSVAESGGEIPLAQVRTIRFVDRGRGGIVGMVAGGAAGAAIATGALFFLASGCHPSCYTSRLPVYVLAIPGLLIGGGIGRAVGAPERFTTEPAPGTEQPASPTPFDAMRAGGRAANAPPGDRRARSP